MLLSYNRLVLKYIGKCCFILLQRAKPPTMWTSATKNFRNKPLANIKRTRFEHLQETKLSKKRQKNRMKTVRCRKTRAYRLTKSTPSAKCCFYRLSKPQKGKLSLSNKHGKIANNFLPCQKVNLPITVVFPHCAEILI